MGKFPAQSNTEGYTYRMGRSLNLIVPMKMRKDKNQKEKKKQSCRPTGLCFRGSAPKLDKHCVMVVVDEAPFSGIRWVTRTFGDINNLVKERFQIPAPSPDEVTINVHAIGINYADIFAVLGVYSVKNLGPFTPGFEISGTIQAIGSNVYGYEVGDHVMALTRYGGYATVVNLNESFVHPMESNWSFAEAAAWPCQALTAWYALSVLAGLNKGACRMQASPNKRVVVHSSAGAVGLLLVDLIRYIGGEVIATVAHAQQVPLLLQRGVPRDHVIVRGHEDVAGFEKTVRRRLNLNSNDGVDAVIDPVMGRYFHEGRRLLLRGGRYVIMGTASLMPSKPTVKRSVRSILMAPLRYFRRSKNDPVVSMKQHKNVCKFDMGRMFECPDVLKGGFEELSDMGMHRPFISRSFAFDDVHAALLSFRAAQTGGKTVLIVQDDHLYRYR